jgi:hypothetical protein
MLQGLNDRCAALPCPSSPRYDAIGVKQPQRVLLRIFHLLLQPFRQFAYRRAGVTRSNCEGPNRNLPFLREKSFVPRRASSLNTLWLTTPCVTWRRPAAEVIDS